MVRSVLHPRVSVPGLGGGGGAAHGQQGVADPHHPTVVVVVALDADLAAAVAPVVTLPAAPGAAASATLARCDWAQTARTRLMKNVS